MAVVGLGLLGSASASTAGTTLAITNSTGAIIPAGTLIHITGCWDNIASVTAPTITCSTVGGATATVNHATAIGSGVTTTAGSGVWHQCIRARTTADIAIGATIATLTSNQSAVVRAAHAEGWSGALATLRGTVTTGVSTTGSPTVTTTGTALVIGDLVIGSVSFENSAQMTADADTVGGSWPPIIGTFTTGGTAAANVGTGSQFKIITATGTQTFNPTGGVADTVACVYSVTPAPTPASATGTGQSTGSANPGINATPKTALLTDTFSTTIDSKWNTLGAPVIESGQLRLDTTTPTATSIKTRDIYDLSGSSILLKLTPPTPGTNRHCSLQIDALLTGAGITYDVYGSPLTLKFLAVSGGLPSSTTIAYDPVAHAWLRIRYATPTVFFDTSPDGVTWTQAATQSMPGVTGVYVSLVANQAATDGATSAAYFDSLNTPPVIYQATAITDVGQFTGSAAAGIIRPATATGTGQSDGSAAATMLAIASATGTGVSTGSAAATVLTPPTTATGTGTFTGSATTTLLTSLPVTVVQAAYRLYADGTETGSAPLAAQDTGYSIDRSVGDVSLQLRTRLQSANVADVALASDFRLQWEKNASGTWVDVATPTPTLTEGYPDSHYTGNVTQVTVDQPRTGQSFLGNGQLLTRVGFPLGRSGAPDGTITAVLYAHTGTFGGADGTPSGAALATATTVVDNTSFSTSARWTYFDFDGTFVLANGTPYVVALISSVTVAAVNAVNITIDSTSPSHPGRLAVFALATGLWTVPTNRDAIFEVYTKPTPAPTTVVGNTSSPVTLADSYDEIYTNSSDSLTADRTQLAQSFLGNGQALSRAAFNLSKVNSPVGTLTANLYAHTGTFGTTGLPTGPPLATSTIIASTSISAINQWYYFDFDGTFTLANGTPYFIALTTAGAAFTTNRLAVNRDSSAGRSHPGAAARCDVGVWSVSGSDMVFRVYTQPPGSTFITDGAPTTSRLTGGTGTFQPGKISVDGQADDVGWFGNNYTELLYAITLKQANLANGDTLRFRVLRNGSTTGQTYTQVPTIPITDSTAVTNSGMWWFGANNWIDFTPGSFAGIGAYTMAVLARPDGANSRFLSAWNGSTELADIYFDTNHLYGSADFSSGFGTFTSGTWYVLAITKPAGSAHYRFHSWPYVAAATGAMTHGEAAGAGNHPDFSTLPDKISVGRAINNGGNGVISVTAAWDRALSDAEMDTLVSSHLSAWKALSPNFLVPLNDWDGVSNVTDKAGTSTFIGLTGSIDVVAGAPGFDFSLAPGPVTATLASSWNIRATAAKTLAQTWNVRVAVGPVTLATSWNVRAPVSTTLLTSWNVRAPAVVTLVTSWNIRAPAGITLLTSWNIRAPAGTTLLTSWNVRAATAVTLVTNWNIRVSVGKTLVTNWNVRATAAMTLVTNWNVRATAAVTLVTNWNIRVSVGKTLAQTWVVRAVVGQSLVQTWNVRASVGTTLAQTWNVRASVGKTLAQTWVVRAAVGQSLAQTWNVRASVNKTLVQNWNVRVAVGPATLATSWNVRAGVTTTLGQSWNIRALVATSVGQSWSVRALAGQTLVQTWVVRAFATVTLPQGWNTRAFATVTLAQSWNLRALVGGTLAESWRVRATATGTLATSWNTRAFVTITLTQSWNVRSSLSAVLVLLATNWNVRAPATRTLAESWNVRAPAISTLVEFWNVRATVVITLLTSWKILQAGGQPKVWNGIAWVAKPAKVWSGSAWVAKPMKVWNGTSWNTVGH